MNRPSVNRENEHNILMKMKKTKKVCFMNYEDGIFLLGYIKLC